jgi:TfoX/Sxy family transcriptional regulator of competence genes
MAYDQDLADRIRELIAGAPDVTERKMFGGLAFMVQGNMACGPVGDVLMIRVGPDDYEDALEQANAREMKLTGKPMKGFVELPVSALRSDEVLADWIDRGVDYALSLPPK